ncbi:MAG TPA: AMP-binding protein [Candidatus Lokiarchaeia archaeon]|nr:AMP-binding protein [Candidatus Lokiarchaeia archaeon]
MASEEPMPVDWWKQHWPPETPRELEYPPMKLDDILRNNAKEFPDHQAIYFEGFRMTHRQLDEAVDQLATGLSKLGVQKGDVVLTYLPNVPQAVISFYATVRLGAIVNPIIPLNKYAEILHQATDSQGKILIMLDSLYEEHLHRKDLSRMSSLKYIILTGLGEYLPGIKRVLGKALKKVPYMKEWPSKAGDIPVLKFQDVLQSGVPTNIPPVDINPQEDVAVLIYTGGTTGAPKGVQTTHANLVVNAIQGLNWVSTQKPDILKTRGVGGEVIVLPLAHSFGLSIGMNIGLLFGYKLILFPQPPTPLSKMLAVMAKENATFCPGVTTLWNRINLDPASPQYKSKLKSFAACLSGASPLPLEVKQKFEEITGAQIIEGYGMSEASPLLTASPFNNFRINTVGFPVPDTFVMIVDPDEGERVYPQCPHCEPYCTTNCGPDEEPYIGEIIASGPQIMKGYLNRPEENAKVLRVKDLGNGERTWYYTSDIGCVSSEGYLRIKDRKRDLIKYKGHSVFPRDVQDLLYQHPAIKEAGVVGIKDPDPEVGESIKAFVSLKDEFKGKVTSGEIVAWAKENMAFYKYPRQVQIVDELPLSLIGKVLRRELREEEGKQDAGPAPDSENPESPEE